MIKMLAMDPPPHTRVTVISKDVMSPYSGMLPGNIGGVYTKEECHLDLNKGSPQLKLRFVRAPFVANDVVSA